MLSGLAINFNREVSNTLFTCVIDVMLNWKKLLIAG